MCNAGHAKISLNVPKIYISYSRCLTKLMRYIKYPHFGHSTCYIYHAVFLTVCALHLEMRKEESTGNEFEESSVSRPQHALSFILIFKIAFCYFSRIV